MEEERVPSALRPLIPCVDKFGKVRGDDARYELEEQISHSPALLQQVKNCAETIGQDHLAAFDSWMHRESLEFNEELAKFYFFFLLLTEMDLWPRRATPLTIQEELDDAIKTIDQPIRSARSIGQIVHGVMEIIDLGVSTDGVIDRLKRMCNSEIPNLACWAEVAIAILKDEREQRAPQIYNLQKQCVLADRSSKDFGVFHAGDDGVDLTLSVGTAIRFFEMAPRALDKIRLISAATVGNVEFLESLIPRCNINTRDHNGSTALIAAVDSGHHPAAELLLNNGADPNLTDSDGDAPIHYAAAREDGEIIIELLANFGANLQAIDSYGDTPLQLARRNQFKNNCRVLKKLIRSKR